MITYLFTSPAFAGQIVFVFEEKTGMLVQYDVTTALLSPEQLLWITTRSPRTINELKAVASKTKDGKLTVREDYERNVSFEMFWNKYNDKARSSKKKTEKAWQKMKQSERDKAYNFISRYERLIPPGTEKKYATTYLADELWNN